MIEQKSKSTTKERLLLQTNTETLELDYLFFRIKQSRYLNERPIL